MPSRPPIHLAAALDGAGWHPAAWREPDAAAAADLLRAPYWVAQARTAQAGLLDFITIEDGFTIQSDDADNGDGDGARSDRVRGRLDAALIAARIAPVTRHLGIVPTVTTTHTEPFHVSKTIATIDYVSTGRAGWRVQIGARPGEARLFGRRTLPPLRTPQGARSPAAADLFAEAADHVEVVRRLWDSWEDDAEIRDAATGRFIDRDKLHAVDFVGRHFSVRGPSITPRPPQGQPPVVALAHDDTAIAFAAAAADVVLTTPQDTDDVARLVDHLRAARAGAGRDHEPVLIFADLLVYLDHSGAAAAARRDRLDENAGLTYAGDAAAFAGTPDALADLLTAWSEAGLDGFRLRPAAVPHDLHAIARDLAPRLQARSLLRRRYDSTTLRGLLGLPRPANRYAAAPHMPSPDPAAGRTGPVSAA